MIQLEQPSIAVNDVDANARYHMWRTFPVRRRETTRERIINDVRSHALAVPNGGKVENLVISCHGYPGYLHLGEGFTQRDLQMFVSWSGLIKTIWLMGCYIGRNNNLPIQTDSGPYHGDGRRFCTDLAVITGANVLSSTELQVSRQQLYPYGYISELEGRVSLFEGGTGQILAWARNRSAWQDNRGIWHGQGETR